MSKLIAYLQEDFSHLIILPSSKRKLILRDLIGKDFYFISLIKNEYPQKLDTIRFILDLILRLSIEPFKIDNEELLNLPSNDFNPLVEWVRDNKLKTIMDLNDWLELCYHLQKQRWTSDTEWLETIPITKVITMSDIQTTFHEKVNKELKRK